MRALKYPYPNAFSFMNGEKIMFNCASKLEGPSGDPGTILALRNNGIIVGTGDGVIFLSEYRSETCKKLILKVGEKFDA